MSWIDEAIVKAAIWRGRKHVEKLGKEYKMEPKPTFGAAVKTGTGIAGAVTATLAIIAMWIPVFTSGEPITELLITQSLGVIGLWLTVIFARRGIMKSGPVGQ